MMKALLCVVVLGAPLSARSQAAEKKLSLLALDQELVETVFVRSDDPNAGVSLQVLEVPTGKVKQGWFMESRKDERLKIKQMTRKRFPIEARVDQVEPDGKYTILGAPDAQKKNYQILVLRDGRIGVLATLPLLHDEAKTNYAKGMLKEVVWAPNGKLVLCVVNQKMDMPDGKYDVDEVHFVRFRAWKVKWTQPENDGGPKSPQ